VVWRNPEPDDLPGAAGTALPAAAPEWQQQSAFAQQSGCTTFSRRRNMTGFQRNTCWLLGALTVSTLLALPPPALAADLRIVWEEGFYPEEDKAIEAVVAAYEQESGKDVELSFYSQEEVTDKALAALEAGDPPDVFLSLGGSGHLPQWALDDVLADLSDVIEPIEDEFYPGVLNSTRLPNKRTGKSAYYAVPIGQYGHYIHVWKGLLDQAGISVEDIPQDWDAFWAFWCNTVQPAVRKTPGHQDFYGIGLPMSADASDTLTGLDQFRDAYGVAYLSPDGKPMLEDPSVREKVVAILTDYTAIWSKGCTPPDSAKWANIDNNKSFHDERVAMTINSTLSISNALRAKRPEDYYQNTVTIQWPNGPDGKPFPIETGFIRVVVFKDAKNVEGAKDFLRYLLTEGRLGTYLEASLGRGLPTMPALLETPFWQDPKDPHRTAAVSQLGQPVALSYSSLNPKYGQVDEEAVWEKAVHRVVADGLTRTAASST
jgi:multiple sugar transport system substrate-binding protein